MDEYKECHTFFKPLANGVLFGAAEESMRAHFLHINDMPNGIYAEAVTLAFRGLRQELRGLLGMQLSKEVEDLVKRTKEDVMNIFKFFYPGSSPLHSSGRKLLKAFADLRVDLERHLPKAE